MSDSPDESLKYVQVPIPEQYVPRVMEHMLMLMAKDAVQPWQPEEVHDLFLSSGEEVKAVLSYTARRIRAGRQVHVDQINRDLELPHAQVFRIIRELNDQAGERQRPQIAWIHAGVEELANGRQVKRRFVQMGDRHAELLEQADEADRAENPSPLPGGSTE